MGEGKTDFDLEWEKRILCSDGNCIGVIGPDGRCKECDRPNDAEVSVVGKDDSGEAFVPEPDDDDMTDIADPLEAVAEDDEKRDLEWENRRLCSDGNCIGVIGSDGKCKECGRPFEG